VRRRGDTRETAGYTAPDTTVGRTAAFSARGPVLAGTAALVALVGGFGGWSVSTRLSGAVIAPGQIEVANHRQIVQHPDGGIVAMIAVREGDRVSAGDVLIRLDGATLGSERMIVENALYATMARRARLAAERDGKAEVRLPRELTGAAAVRPALAELISDEVRLFEARSAGLAQSARQLNNRLDEIASEIDGMDAQSHALTRQLELARTEERIQQQLLDKGLTQTQRVLALQRDIARIEGDIGSLAAARAQAAERATGFQIERDALYSDRRQEVIAELRDAATREGELAEKRRAILERISRLDIRAPASGIVLGLQVTTPRSVVRAADPLLYIVPQDRPMIVAAQIPTIHVGQVHVGQDVRLHFAAFSSRTSPDLAGTVGMVAADAMHDERTMKAYYRIEIAIEPDEIAKLGKVALVPGMPVEAFVRTGDQSPMSYLLKPFADYFARAFRES
jgi:HlyD family secretion protein